MLQEGGTERGAEGVIGPATPMRSLQWLCEDTGLVNPKSTRKLSRRSTGSSVRFEIGPR